MAELWNERRSERDLPPSSDRSGSCKFAALFAREIFGGRLAGNREHVFVILDDRIIDLNRDQLDVVSMGDKAHIDDQFSIEHPEYRDSLSSCMDRVRKFLFKFEEIERQARREERSDSARSYHSDVPSPG